MKRGVKESYNRGILGTVSEPPWVDYFLHDLLFFLLLLMDGEREFSNTRKKLLCCSRH